MRETGVAAGETDATVPAVIGAGVVTLALLWVPLALTTGGDGAEPERSPSREVAAVSEAYLEAWSQEDLEAMAGLVTGAPVDFAAAHRQVVEALGVTEARFVPGRPEVAGTTAAVPFLASLDLAGLGTWDYEGRLDLSYGVPELPAIPVDEVVDDVVDGGGGPEVAGEEPVPAPRIEVVDADQARWSVRWSPASIHPALATGQTLGAVREVPERAELLDVTGTALTGEGAPDLVALSSQVLGRVAIVDDEAVAVAERQPGDAVGISGLQAAFDEELSGRASGRVEVVGAGGEVVAVVHEVTGEDPEAVRTTFDAGIQAAAEAALSRVSRPAALVAIDAPTGQVRAVASRPTVGFNRALQGQYPPGSTFKVVTATALLASGVTTATPAPCPATTSVEGYRFSNAGGEVLGDIPFATAFYRSCNTAFVGLVGELDEGALAAAAEAYGFNGDPELPVLAEAGRFPEPTGAIDEAAAAIGQGRVTATPLQMASVAAAVAAGAWHPPTMVVEGEPALAPEPAGADVVAGAAPTLRQLMYRVVAEGTGTAARLSGEPVGGKTGTAEFGAASPPRTHAWFIGFRGDLAVAVVVEDAGFGGTVAAPVARSFFAAAS